MERILVPIDFSANALNALEYAASLAGLHHSTLVLVHVIPVDWVTTTESTMLVMPDTETEAYFTKQLCDLAKSTELNHEFRFKVQAVCKTGLFLNELLRQITKLNPDLVVMGTKGASTFMQKMLGSNTASLLKQAPCPVLAIPGNVRYKGIRKIAFGSMLHTDEIDDLKQLLSLTKHFEPEVTLVHIESTKTLKDRTDIVIFKHIADAFPDHRLTLAQVEKDDPVAGLKIFVEENAIDVLALTIHEKSVYQALFKKSVSQQLAFNSPLPLLTLPGTEIKQKYTRHAVEPAAG